MKKAQVVGTIRINAYDIVRRAVEEGVRYGWNRAHKHTDKPDEAAILEHIENAVLTELCEVLKFDE